MSPHLNRKQFGTFELDLESGELRRAGIRLRLQDKPFQLLVLLLERPGEVVTREAVRERLWPADTFVDFDHGLNTAVRKLRQVLGDSAESPRFIETLARRGYRFVAPVTSVDTDSTLATPPSAASASTVDTPAPPVVELGDRQPQPAALKRRLAIAGTVLALLLAVGWMASVARRQTAETPDRPSAASSMRIVVLPFRVFTSSEDDKAPWHWTRRRSHHAPGEYSQPARPSNRSRNQVRGRDGPADGPVRS